MPQNLACAHTYFFGGKEGSSEFGIDRQSDDGDLVNAFEQLANVNLERAGELHDVFHPNVSFAAFDPADVSCVKLPYPRHVRKMQLACAWA